LKKTIRTPVEPGGQEALSRSGEGSASLLPHVKAANSPPARQLSAAAAEAAPQLRSESSEAANDGRPEGQAS
jgi:hypothetical protein